MIQKCSLPFGYCVAYSAPHITTVWLLTPLAIIQGIYAKYYSLSLTTIALIVLGARLFDAITDPLIGYYSDRYYRRTGSRKPFMLAGGLLIIFCSYFLYVPINIDTQIAGSQVSAWYFAFWFMAMYLAWTLFEIPHIAWANELAPNSNDKTYIYSCRAFAGYLGMLSFYCIPLLPFFETRDITPETLKVSVICASILMVTFLFYSLNTTLGNSHLSGIVDNQNARPSSCTQSTLRWVTSLRKNTYDFYQALAGNKPLLLFLTAYIFTYIASGMWFGLIFIYVDAYLELGEKFSQMFMLAYLVGIISTPIWYKAAGYFGKKNTWAFASLLVAFSFFYTATLAPGTTSFAALAALKVVQTLGTVCSSVLAPAMMAEIADYGTWKFKVERTATYFSLYTFSAKGSGALAMSIGLGIAGWYGFNPAESVHSAHSIWGLTLAISWMPLILMCIALIFISLSPINDRRHAIIRRRLDARAARVKMKEASCEEKNPKPNTVTTIRTDSRLLPAKQ